MHFNYFLTISPFPVSVKRPAESAVRKDMLITPYLPSTAASIYLLLPKSLGYCVSRPPANNHG